MLPSNAVPTIWPLGVDHRRAGAAAGDVVGGGEVEHRGRVELLARRRSSGPAGGRAARRWRGWKRPAKVVNGVRLLALVGPAGDLAVAEAQREVGVGIEAWPFEGVAHPGDALAAVLDRRHHLLLPDLPGGARQRDRCAARTGSSGRPRRRPRPCRRPRASRAEGRIAELRCRRPAARPAPRGSPCRAAWPPPGRRRPAARGSWRARTPGRASPAPARPAWDRAAASRPAAGG